MNCHSSHRLFTHADTSPFKDHPPEQYRPVQQHVAARQTQIAIPSTTTSSRTQNQQLGASQNCQFPSTSTKIGFLRALIQMSPRATIQGISKLKRSLALAVAAMRAFGRAQYIVGHGPSEWQVEPRWGGHHAHDALANDSQQRW